MSAPVYAAPVATQYQPAMPSRVSIVDINMPFGSMVLFMVKWSLAAVPALIILTFIFGIIFSLLFGTLAAMFHLR